jgi:hypothetical protein
LKKARQSCIYKKVPELAGTFLKCYSTSIYSFISSMISLEKKRYFIIFSRTNYDWAAQFIFKVAHMFLVILFEKD